MTGEDITTIENKHIDSCGTPPQFDHDDYDYLSYFEDEYGEQHIFAYDASEGVARRYLADAGWDPALIDEDTLASVDADDMSKPVRSQLRPGDAGAGLAESLVSMAEEQGAGEMAAVLQDETERLATEPVDLWLRSCVQAVQVRL